jgi:transglutaminase-like putative cysteine protease
MATRRMFVRAIPGRRFDIVLLALVLGAVACLPGVIRATGWAPEADRLIWAALWGAIIGMVVAHSPLPPWMAWLLGAGLGLEYSLQFAGRLLPSLRIIATDVGRLARLVWDLVWQQTLPAALPELDSITLLAARTRTMLANLTAWYAAVRTGETTRDTTAMVIGVTLIVWLLSWHAAFEMYRRRRAFAALLPLGVAVVANVAFTDIGMPYVHIYLALTILTLAWANGSRMERIWARLGLDFSDEIRRDIVIAGSVLAAIVLVVALVLPYTVYSRAVYFFWDNYGPRFTAFYQDLDRAFAGRNPVPTRPADDRGLGAHQISGGGSLDETAVLMVVTSDPAPLPEEDLYALYGGQVDISQVVPKHYWRQRTYDTYTGHGWDSSERREVAFPEDTPWTTIPYPHSVLTQTFTTLRTTGTEQDVTAQAPGPLSLAYAANEPIVFDTPYTAILRDEGDLAASLVEGPEYTVVSAIPQATVNEMRAAEQPYPDEIAQRFLALPPIPERVRQLAHEVVESAEATTRYDKARAIEAYIRQFTYDLDLDPPPLDTDFVDYFLFTAQRGYCDYSASAMVVMLRSVGVAARYASGYAMGYYDYSRGAWVVRENDAHAWAEVYFPGLGWIEFEPTPIQTVFVRTESLTGPSNLAALPVVEEAPSIPAIWLWGGGLLLTVLLVIVWPPRWFRRSRATPQVIIRSVYAQLLRRAQWLGLAPRGGQTPQEYLHAFSQEVERRTGPDGTVSRDIALISSAYQRARYSNHTMDVADGYRVEGAWRRLRGRLWRLALARPPRRGT